MQGCKQASGLALFKIRALCANGWKVNNTLLHVSEQNDTGPELISERY